ncbi:MAG: EamA family transporter [Armatimonadota bacterium]
MRRDSAFLWALVTALFWGGGPVCAKPGLEGVDPLVGLIWRGLVAGFTVASVGVATNSMKLVAGLPLRSKLFLAGEGLLGSVLGQLAYFRAIKPGTLARVTPVASSFPLVTVLLSVVFLAEKVTWQHPLGAALVVAGVILLKQAGQ